MKVKTTAIPVQESAFHQHTFLTVVHKTGEVDTPVKKKKKVATLVIKPKNTNNHNHGNNRTHYVNKIRPMLKRK